MGTGDFLGLGRTPATGDDGLEPQGDAEASEAPSVPPVPEPAQQAATAPQAAPSGDVQRYKALRRMGGVPLGGEFEATADDPRVKSGYVRLLGPLAPDAPSAVSEALGGTGSTAS